MTILVDRLFPGWLLAIIACSRQRETPGDQPLRPKQSTSEAFASSDWFCVLAVYNDAFVVPIPGVLGPSQDFGLRVSYARWSQARQIKSAWVLAILP